jgi:hypothetical protein
MQKIERLIKTNSQSLVALLNNSCGNANKADEIAEWQIPFKFYDDVPYLIYYKILSRLILYLILVGELLQHYIQHLLPNILH